MKKLLSIILSGIMLTAFATGCSDDNDNETTTTSESTISSETTEAEQTTEQEITDVKIAALKGPTSMGLIKVMNDAKNGPVNGNNYEFSVLGAVDEITSKIVKGEVDIAAVPANLASVLYNNTEKDIEVIAINTLGVIYIVENGNTINSVADLKGKTIYASGKGATPEYGLNFILEQNGIDPEKDVNIEWKSEHTECAAALASNDNAIAMLPEPFVTSVLMSNENARVALDLTKEWEKTNTDEKENGAMITGVVVARKDFVENHKDALDTFLASYKESVEFVNSDIDSASTMIEEFDIFKKAVAQKAIPNCNIVYIDGEEMQTKLSKYLEVLYSQNEKAVGGTLPDDNFYYKK